MSGGCKTLKMINLKNVFRVKYQGKLAKFSENWEGSHPRPPCTVPAISFKMDILGKMPTITKFNFEAFFINLGTLADH